MKVLAKRVPLLALPLAALAACTTPTPYQPLTTQGAAHGGYSDQRIEENRYQVSRRATRQLDLLLTGHANAEESVLYPEMADSGHKTHASMAYDQRRSSHRSPAEHKAPFVARKDADADSETVLNGVAA